MSQATVASSASSGRIALAIGIIALVIGASALGYAVYLGQSQLPSQISAVSVNVKPSDKTIRIDWTLDDTGEDRFNPQYVTVAQGDNLTIMLITNDTGDAHTFTIGLELRGFQSAKFQLNNSIAGLESGQFTDPPDEMFTGPPGNSCFDNTGTQYNCNVQEMGTPSCTPTPPDTSCFGLSSTGWLGQVTVPGVYKFFCFYHQKGGMFGYLIVLPNTFKG